MTLISVAYVGLYCGLSLLDIMDRAFDFVKSLFATRGGKSHYPSVLFHKNDSQSVVSKYHVIKEKSTRSVWN